MISGIFAPGNTPDSSVYNKGMSSWISFGTTVSHTLPSKIDCSKPSNCDSSTGCYCRSTISCRFMLPAEFSTDFNARSPKS